MQIPLFLYPSFTITFCQKDFDFSSLCVCVSASVKDMFSMFLYGDRFMGIIRWRHQFTRFYVHTKRRHDNKTEKVAKIGYTNNRQKVTEQ